MKKSIKIIFIIFNTVLFLSNFILVAFLPKTLLFGWMPSQVAFMAGSMAVASAVWGLYFNKFYDTQGHIDELYGEE